jgi:hydrogenase expression/formation protein HypC
MTERCITCGDVAVPMRIVELRGAGAVCVDEDAVLHDDVAVELVEPVAAGQRVLVHAGVAIARVAEPA